MYMSREGSSESRYFTGLPNCSLLDNATSTIIPGADTYTFEPRHGKMCLRGKFGHFEIL